MGYVGTRHIPFGGYVIHERFCPEYSVCDVEKPGYDFPVAVCNDVDCAKAWILENPDGDKVVEMIEAEKDERRRAWLIDVLCG